MPSTRLVPKPGTALAEEMRSCFTTASAVRGSVHAKRQTEQVARAEQMRSIVRWAEALQYAGVPSCMRHFFPAFSTAHAVLNDSSVKSFLSSTIFIRSFAAWKRSLCRSEEHTSELQSLRH